MGRFTERDDDFYSIALIALNLMMYHNFPGKSAELQKIEGNEYHD